MNAIRTLLLLVQIILIAAYVTAANAANGKAPVTPAATGKTPETTAAPGKTPETTAAPGKAPETTAATGKAPATSAATGKAPETPAVIKEPISIFNPIGALGKIFKIGNSGLYLTARGAKKVANDAMKDGAKLLVEPFAQLGKPLGLESVIRDTPIKTMEKFFLTTDGVFDLAHTTVGGLAEGVEKVGDATAPLINAPAKFAKGAAGAAANVVSTLTNKKNLLDIDLLNFKTK